MNKKSRSSNSKRNLFYGLLGRFVILLLQFVSRTIFIHFLGEEFLGVNGLYGNILNVLSLAELGIDNVMLYSFYKPIAENDKEKIVGLLNYYKKIYRIIATVVLLVGLSIVPILGHIVNSELPHSKLILYYLLFLLNSVVSYLVTYKATFVKADQNIYVVSNNTTIFTILRHVLQTVFLLITRNYTVYLIVQVCCTIWANFRLSLKADKMYPFIKTKGAADDSEKATIWQNIKYALLYKVSNILIGNTDNILISVLVSTTAVGYYSNYSMFIFNISVLINMLVTSVFSSFGNLYSTGDTEKCYHLFGATVLFFQWLATVCSLCFFTIFNDFIALWAGKEFVFGTATVFVIVLNFYNETVLNPLWLYRETMGLFKEVRYIRIYTGMINLVLSVVLGRIYGIFGILISTFIAISCTYSWYEPYVILKTLGKSVKEYWLSQLTYSSLAALSFVITVFLCSFLNHGWIDIILKIGISGTVSTLVFVIFCFRSKSFILLKQYMMNVLVRKR